MGYHVYGTDISDRIVDFAERNLEWLQKLENGHLEGFRSAAARGEAPAAHGRPLEEARERRARSSFRSDDKRTTQRVDGPAGRGPKNDYFQVSVGDATSFSWQLPIDAVACEGYLGKPMSNAPSEMVLKEQKQECSSIVLGFLKNLAPQIKKGTPVVIAAPAWLRPNGTYSRLEILDQISDMGYNVNNKSREGLFYYREGQIVARDIIILRKD